MLWTEASESVGHFFDQKSHGVAPRWVTSIWKRELEGAPFSDKVKRDFISWRATGANPPPGDDLARWLDSMTYQHYLEKILGLGPEVTAYADPILAGAIGLGCDALSAYAALPDQHARGQSHLRGVPAALVSRWQRRPGPLLRQGSCARFD